MRKYKEVKIRAGSTIDEAVVKLLSQKENGVLAYIEFNGSTIYSDEVTLDNAYQKITGKTVEEFDRLQKQKVREYNEKKQEHLKNIPELTNYWIDEGMKVLNKNKWSHWTDIVPIRLGDMYHGMELGNCLDIVKVLQNGSMEDAKIELGKQSHSGMSHGLVCVMVSEFSDKGKEFVEYIYS